MKHRILIVDDDEMLRKLTVMVVTRRFGYDAAEAGSGEEALRIWDGHFDLLLTDLVMPGGMDGFELGLKVRALKPIPTVIVSGYAFNAVRRDALPEGFTFLHKPYFADDLEKVLSDLLSPRPQE